MNREQKRKAKKELTFDLESPKSCREFMKSLRIKADNGQLIGIKGGKDSNGKFLTFDEMSDQQILQVARDAFMGGLQ